MLWIFFAMFNKHLLIPVFVGLQNKTFFARHFYVKAYKLQVDKLIHGNVFLIVDVAFKHSYVTT